MKPRTIADALIAKHGTTRAHFKVKGRMARSLNFKMARGLWLTWMLVGQAIERIGNAEGWR